MRRKRLILGASGGGSHRVVLLLGGIFRREQLRGRAARRRQPTGARRAQFQAGFSRRRQRHGDDRARSSRRSCARCRTTSTRSTCSASPTSSGRARPATRPTTRSRSRLCDRALRLAPRDLVATSGLGSLALSRHRFAEALVLGRKAHAISPTTALNYGITGDALVELGRYPAAFEAFDTMATLQPGPLLVCARLARPRAARPRARGDRDDEARRPGRPRARASPRPGRASSSASSTGRSAASAAAERQDRAALSVFPGYHYALDALARIEAAKGHNRAAIALEQQAVDRIPLPQYVAQLGDLYRVNGQPAQARKQYALIGVIERLLVANGVKTDLETALFDVDHGIRLPARARARAHGPRRAPLDRRRRRARVGPLPQRPLRRSARPLEAGAPPRHARRAEALPPRHDRALPR